MANSSNHLGNPDDFRVESYHNFLVLALSLSCFLREIHRRGGFFYIFKIALKALLCTHTPPQK